MALASEQSASILVVEDDASINAVVCSFLGKAGYSCTPAYSGTEAKLLVADGVAFDLVITDLMLPGMAGDELVQLIRAQGATPIVVISAKDAVPDRIDLLRSGADDYLVKPFDLEELLARVEVQLRRGPTAHGQAGRGAHSVRFASWVLDPDDRSFLVDGEPVRLTRTEFEMVHALMRHPGRVFMKKDLSAAAWGDEAALEEKSVSTHIGNIRSKLKDTGTEGCIETVWGVGFKLAEPDG